MENFAQARKNRKHFLQERRKPSHTQNQQLSNGKADYKPPMQGISMSQPDFIYDSPTLHTQYTPLANITSSWNHSDQCYTDEFEIRLRHTANTNQLYKLGKENLISSNLNSPSTSTSNTPAVVAPITSASTFQHMHPGKYTIQKSKLIAQILDDNDEETNINQTDIDAGVTYNDIGDPVWKCIHCKAIIWYDERINKDKQSKNPRFALCCGDGKIELPLLEDPPQPMRQLLSDSNSTQSKHFQANIRSYNLMFAFTSPGTKVDTRYNTGKGPPTFYNMVKGIILLETSYLCLITHPSLYSYIFMILRTKLKTGLPKTHKNKDILDEDIIIGIKNMLDKHNRYTQKFRMARDKVQSSLVCDLKLKLISDKQSDGRLYNLPNTIEVVALIVGEEHTGNKRDIIIERQSGSLKRINELHPTYLPLQYPLLYPKGEDGYRPNILHKAHPNSHVAKRKKVTMREYFCFRMQSRDNKAQTIMHSRRLFQQWIVDGYTMIESQALNYVRQHQQELRVDKYINLNVCNNGPETHGNDKGKRIILPSSFVGSRRYMEQLYFDGMAICGHIGFPDMFLTLTCNPAWPEIQRRVRKCNLRLDDCPDVVS
ncbi:hypothetical protein GmHk_06G016479 [Glycine max]|nr:hypothetical protein GmHk_06G016479 [Glycine max]